MDNTVINSCIMLANALHTPVGLNCVFDEPDLIGIGIEIDSHITILYAAGQRIDKTEILDHIELSLGEDDFKVFMKLLEDTNNMESIFEHFELDIFENDTDYIILRLLDTSPMYSFLNIINRIFRTKYGVSPDFNYTPHMTLAHLKSGEGKKYLESEKLRLILEKSKVTFEDLVISYGVSSELTDREKYGITTFHTIPRYFREENLRKELSE